MASRRKAASSTPRRAAQQTSESKASAKRMSSEAFAKAWKKIKENTEEYDFEELASKRVSSKQVYGELNPNMVSDLIAKTAMTSDDVFFDLGSGVGNVVLQVAAETGCECVGIESRKDLHDVALALKKQTEEAIGSKCSLGEVELRLGDLATETVTSDISRATVVLLNNLCWTPELELVMLEKLRSNLSPGSRVIATRIIAPRFRPSSLIFKDHPCHMFEFPWHELMGPTDGVSWSNKPIPYNVCIVAKKDKAASEPATPVKPEEPAKEVVKTTPRAKRTPAKTPRTKAKVTARRTPRKTLTKKEEEEEEGEESQFASIPLPLVQALEEEEREEAAAASLELSSQGHSQPILYVFHGTQDSLEDLSLSATPATVPTTPEAKELDQQAPPAKKRQKTVEDEESDYALNARCANAERRVRELEAVLIEKEQSLMDAEGQLRKLEAVLLERTRDIELRGRPQPQQQQQQQVEEKEEVRHSTEEEGRTVTTTTTVYSVQETTTAMEGQEGQEGEADGRGVKRKREDGEEVETIQVDNVEDALGRDAWSCSVQ